jgi:hypothetical protein
MTCRDPTVDPVGRIQLATALCDLVLREYVGNVQQHPDASLAGGAGAGQRRRVRR